MLVGPGNLSGRRHGGGMSELFTFLIAGVVTGAIYAVTATGLVVTYNTTGVFNFADGAVLLSARPSVCAVGLSRLELADGDGATYVPQVG